MSDAIGTTLGRGIDLAVQRMLVRAGSTVGVTASDASFASVMQAELTSRLASHGVTLPAPPADDPAPTSDSAEDVWKRVELQQSALHGQGDAIMAALQQASDERWERHGRDRAAGFDLSEFF